MSPTSDSSNSSDSSDSFKEEFDEQKLERILERVRRVSVGLAQDCVWPPAQESDAVSDGAHSPVHLESPTSSEGGGRSALAAALRRSAPVRSRPREFRALKLTLTRSCRYRRRPRRNHRLSWRRRR